MCMKVFKGIILANLNLVLRRRTLKKYYCLALIISILCDSFILKREKDFWFSLQDIGPQTPDRTEPNRLGERNKDIFLPFSGFCCSGFCRCHVLRAALLFSPNLRLMLMLTVLTCVNCVKYVFKDRLEEQI